MMPAERLNNPKDVEAGQIQSILATGKTATIQFSELGYDQKLLEKINELCRTFGDQLEIRFYGHHRPGFDASWLAWLPDVSWLSVDCLNEIRSTDHLCSLQNLRKLSLGVFEMDDPQVMSRFPLEELVELRIGESRKANVDLSPLQRCSKLSSLSIASHTTGLALVGQLPKLRSLWLRSLPIKQSLGMIGGIPNLSKLSLILGGREGIAEVASPTLEELEIIRVRGLASLGDLERFPALTSLQVEDQIRLRSIDLGKAAESLEILALYNCKNLGEIGDLRHLVNLKDLGIARTLLDLDRLLSSPLPSSLRTVRLWTGRPKEDRMIRARLDEMGYGEFPSYQK